MITATGTNKYTADHRGTDYYLHLDSLGRWELWSQRKALRAAMMGGSIRHFESLAEVSANVTAFRGIELLAA